MSKPAPIFIHSLFRTGSTYIFNVFRRAPAACFCYQEPLHELAWYARMAPDRLLIEPDEVALRRLRHPPLARGYHRELREVWPAWRDSLREEAIYAAYFAPPGLDIGLDYWRALVAAAPVRALFQECRTAARIAPIRSALGGTHLYLWRNPWDQWWSYKVSPYFGAVSQLIMCAGGAPPEVDALRRALGIVPCPYPDIGCAITHFLRRPLGSGANYQLFYLLWIHALREGTAHADLLLNIDRLGDCPAYRQGIIASLADAGVRDIDLVDCRVPQGRYSREDHAFFARQEAAVHAVLLQHGWQAREIDALQTLRVRFRPGAWPPEGVFEDDPAACAEQRLREVVMQAEAQAAESVGAPWGRLQDWSFHHLKGLWSLLRRPIARKRRSCMR